jgi:Cdc6-like AAA superfamily ATPase
MFVSGVPGTGKTATIRAVAKHLLKALEDGFNVIIHSIDSHAQSRCRASSSWSSTAWR